MKLINFYLKAKPCPFCGETDELEVTPYERFQSCGGEEENRGACVSVTCNRCSVDVYDHNSTIPDYETRLTLLLEKWNKRGGESDE